MNRRWFLWACSFVLCLSLVRAEESFPPPPDRVIDIPMRDGTKLPANLFLPHDSAKKEFPCILVRQPLGKDSIDLEWVELIKAGYALIVQSTRSYCDETGKEIPYLTDGWSDDHRPADGYDTVQWIASSDFCDGTVSTIGVSASGITQFLLAPASPSSLKCQHIEMAPPSMYQYAVYPGGQFRKEQIEGWLQVHGRHPSVIDWLKNKSRYDDFWGRFNVLEYSDQIKVPQVHIGGWFDIFLQGTLDAFFAAQQHSQPDVRKKHKLIIGPWGHRWRYTAKLGEFSLQPKQLFPPVKVDFKSWLDCHVRGEKNNVSSAPTVQYYVMGPFDGSSSKGNCWKTTSSWPPPGAEYQRFHLAPDNKLSEKEQEIKPATILFNTQDLVPTIGGRNLFMPDGPRDLQSLVKRDDVICYATDALKEDVEVTGRLWANLYVADTNRERDVCLRLVDIWPNGQHYLIAEGVSHVMPRYAYERKASEPRLVITDLWSTSMVFAKGHKIGLLISASNYPACDLSFGSDEEKGTAFTVHSTKKFPSSLALPIMAKDSSTKEMEKSQKEN